MADALSKPLVKPSLARHSASELTIPNDVLLELMKEVLGRGATFHFRAKGWSMAPFIKDGDTITIAPPARVSPGLGRVVAFEHPECNQLLVHRVIGRQGGAFLIQGDNTAGQPDGPVQPGNILGCVIRVEREGHQVALGLGPERYLVAFLSRHGRLGQALRPFRFIKRWLP